MLTETERDREAVRDRETHRERVPFKRERERESERESERAFSGCTLVNYFHYCYNDHVSMYSTVQYSVIIKKAFDPDMLLATTINARGVP